MMECNEVLNTCILALGGSITAMLGTVVAIYKAHMAEKRTR